MRIAILVTAALQLWTTLPTPATAQTSDDQRAIDRARRLIGTHADMMGVPGMQVAVARGDELIWSEGFGFADLEQRVAVTPLTRFPIGSVTKPLTAVAAAALVEEGELDWGDDVRTHVPSFPEKRWPMTVRHLAGHLAGIRHYREGELDSLGSRRYEDVFDALEIFAEDSLLFRPGSDYEYSSFGYNLLSAVVQGAAKVPFLEVVQNRVLRPAGMRHTSPAFTDSLIPHRTETYLEKQGGGRLRAPPVDVSYKWGSAGFMSTAEDLVRFGQALLEHRLLSSENVRTLWTPTATTSGDSTGYALGWYLRATSQGRRVVHHGGSLDRARAHLAIVPSEELVVAVLANTGQYVAFNDEEVLPLTELFLGGREEPRVDPTGRYLFQTRYDDQPTTGWLEIREEGGDFVGTLSFPAGVRPVPSIDVQGTSVHLIATKGSWMHLWLDFGGPEIQGRWTWGPFEERITTVRRLEDTF